MSDVILGDAMALLASLDAGSVPLIVTDPPYGIGYHSNHYKGRNPHAPVTNDWNFQIGRFLHECGRVLTDGGALYLFCRYDVLPLWVPYLAGTGLTLKTAIVWVKDNWSAGDLTGSFGNQYEHILFITKGRHTLRGKRWPNVWTFPRVTAKAMLHPTQKPVPLLRRAIEASSDAGDLVLDPMCGSGSTGAACSECGRSYLLGDNTPVMVDITRRRLSLEAVGDEEAVDLPPDYMPTIPSPAEWGMHPEDVAALIDTLRGNVSALYQPRLFDEVSA